MNGRRGLEDSSCDQLLKALSDCQRQPAAPGRHEYVTKVVNLFRQFVGNRLHPFHSQRTVFESANLQRGVWPGFNIA
jgi:hypothetical protein